MEHKTLKTETVTKKARKKTNPKRRSTSTIYVKRLARADLEKPNLAIGLAVRYFRMKAGLLQRELGVKLGWTRASVVNCEVGCGGRLYFDQVLELINIFGISLDDFYKAVQFYQANPKGATYTPDELKPIITEDENLAKTLD